jgi:hypothetical protein
MTTELLSTRFPTTGRRPWTLELDAEVAPAATGVAAMEAGTLAALMARIPGVDRVSVVPHCAGRYVLVSLTVQAVGLPDAVDRACAFLHSCAVDAGLSPVVLVAARCPH